MNTHDVLAAAQASLDAAYEEIRRLRVALRPLANYRRQLSGDSGDHDWCQFCELIGTHAPDCPVTKANELLAAQ